MTVALFICVIVLFSPLVHCSTFVLFCPDNPFRLSFSPIFTIIESNAAEDSAGINDAFPCFLASLPWQKLPAYFIDDGERL